MINKFESYIKAIESNFEVVKGEVYKLTAEAKKKSIPKARKALLMIIKGAKSLRKELQETYASMPTKKRNISPEKKAEMVAKRKATLEAKKPKKKE